VWCRGPPPASLLPRAQRWGPLRHQALLLFFHQHPYAMLLELGDHPLNLLSHLAEFVLLLHLHL
jgi:hypothetical protein